MSSIKRACVAAVCVALCYVLPLAFHALGAGGALSPMHLPVLLCGLVCGWSYGLFCGVAGPIVSCVLSGMPSPAQLVYMIPELAVYGALAGLGMRFIRTGYSAADIYLSLVPAMILGRVVGGLVQAAVYLSGGEGYSLALWASAYFAGTLPGIVVQLVALPIIVLALEKARLLPARYPKEEKS